MSLKDKSLRIRNKRILSDLEELFITGDYLTALSKIDSIELQYLDEEDQSMCQAYRSACLASQGEFQKGYEIAQHIVQTSGDNPKHVDSLVLAFIVLGNILVFHGRLDDSLKFCDQADEIILTMDSKSRITKSRKANASFARGTNLLSSGEINQGLEYLLSSASLFEEIGNIGLSCATCNNIGESYRLMGKLEQALDYYEKALKIKEEAGFEGGSAITLGNIGIIQFQRGFNDEAADILDQAIDILEESTQQSFLTSLMFYAVIVSIEINDREEAEILVKRMEAIDEKQNSLFTSQYFRVAKAILLKNSERVEDQETAMKLFKEVVEEHITVFDVSVISLLNLCDILLSQLRNSDNEELLVRIQEYVEMAQEIATDQGMSWLRAETYWLQSQISLIELDYEKARNLLNQAQHIAEQDGLHQLARRISSEYDTLLEEQDIWAELSKEKAPLSHRVKAAHIDVHVERMTKLQEADGPDIVNEEPIQFMLVAAHGGYNVVSEEFQKGFKVDESLVSGFLSALTTFSDEIFSLPLDRIKIGDYIMLLRAELPFLFCYVFKGESYSAMQKMNQLIETLRNDTPLWSKLERTIETGAVDDQANHEVSRFVTQVFQSAA
ncbi:MAG: tetratricopeptide repeat protein [Candidatus Thorarchaeota archaeon]